MAGGPPRVKPPLPLSNAPGGCRCPTANTTPSPHLLSHSPADAEGFPSIPVPRRLPAAEVRRPLRSAPLTSTPSCNRARLVWPSRSRTGFHPSADPWVRLTSTLRFRYVTLFRARLISRVDCFLNIGRVAGDCGRTGMEKPLKLFSGNANPALTKEICAYLGINIGQATVSSFSDGEIRVRIEENVRGADVFVAQSCCEPINDSIMELLIMIDALKRSSAYRITAVIPYFGYARQDRKDQPRVPISAKLVADLITTAGADRVLTMDLHAGQIQGFFNIPVDHLYATPVLLDYISKG